MIDEGAKTKLILAENFIIDDWEAIDLLLGFVAAFKVPHTEMLWLKLIGASGTGKTELLRAIRELNFADELEHLSPASLRGGYKPAGRRQPLTMARLNGKLVVTKEFAVLLTARKDDRTTVFGLLRSVHDGDLSSDFGSLEGHLHQKTKFDWVIGTTPYVDQQRQLEASLGSRFIDLRWHTPKDSERLAGKAVENDPRLETIRKELAEQLQRMADSVIIPPKKPEMPYLSKLADFTSRYRTPLRRDSITREIMEVPTDEIESPARVSQALARIGTGLFSIGIINIQPYLLRLALDTIPKTRASVVRAVLEGIKGREEIAKFCGISARALDYIREEMGILGFDDKDDLSFLKPQKEGTQLELELAELEALMKTNPEEAKKRIKEIIDSEIEDI